MHRHKFLRHAAAVLAAAALLAAVVLAGLPQAPSLYASSPEKMTARANVVLKRMVECKKLTQEQAVEIASQLQN